METLSALGVGGLRENMVKPVLLWELRTRLVEEYADNSDSALWNIERCNYDY